MQSKNDTFAPKSSTTGMKRSKTVKTKKTKKVTVVRNKSTKI